MTDRPDLVIYGSPVSPFVRKVGALCAEKDVQFEIEAVNVFDPPEWFVEISPMKRIPVLRDRSLSAQGPHGTIADSSAICAYIEKKHPAPALFPPAPYTHARALMIEEYADTVLAAGGGLGIFRPIYFALVQGKEPDLDKARMGWRQELPPVLAWLDEQLGSGRFFVGEALSIADISVATALMQVELVSTMPLGQWPALEAHHAMMKDRPSIAGPFAKANAIIAKTLPERFDLT